MSARVGIDIGAAGVRVVETSGLNADSHTQITKAAIVPLHPGAVVGGRVVDQVAVAWAVAKAVKDAGVSSHGVIMGLASANTALVRFAVPAALRPDEWALAFRSSGKLFSPVVPLGSAAVSMYPIQDVTDPATGEVATRILQVAMVRQGDVDVLLAVAKAAKVTPMAIDLAGAATMRCLTRAVPGNTDVLTLVDVGATKITVATRHGLHVRSLRTTEGGGADITRALIGLHDCTYAEADDLKMGLRVAPADAAARREQVAAVAAMYGTAEETSIHDESDTSERSIEAVTGATEKIIDTIVSIIETDAADHLTAPTTGIVLCGGTPLLRGFKERLVQRVNVPAHVARPWASVVEGKRTSSVLTGESEEPVMLLALATATGLAMWKRAY